MSVQNDLIGSLGQVAGGATGAGWSTSSSASASAGFESGAKDWVTTFGASSGNRLTFNFGSGGIKTSDEINGPTGVLSGKTILYWILAGLTALFLFAMLRKG